MARNLLADIHASLIKFCQDRAAEYQHPKYPMGFFYFDAYADEKDLPPGDGVGISGLSLQIDDQMVLGNVLIGIITQEDENLFRLTKAMGLLLEALMPENVIAVYDSSNGTLVGNVNILNGTSLMAVAGKANRPVQFIQVSFQTTRSYS